MPLLTLSDHKTVIAVDVNIGEDLVDVGHLLERNPRCHLLLLKSLADQIIRAEVNCVDADYVVAKNVSTFLTKFVGLFDQITPH